MYQLIYSHQDGTVSGIKRLSDGASIPLAEGNMDYQAFLVWNREQATPLDLNSISQEMLDLRDAMIARQEAKRQANRQPSLMVSCRREVRLHAGRCNRRYEPCTSQGGFN